MPKADGHSCVQRKDPNQVELWGLKEGTYLFQLTVTSSDHPEDTANVTVTVLSTKQTEGEGGVRRQHLEPPLCGLAARSPHKLSPVDYCLASNKVGRCRGSFPRWYYDPMEQICKSFVYGGCLGNKNNYLREEECILACRGVQGGPLRGSSGAQATFPQGEWSLFCGQGGGW